MIFESQYRINDEVSFTPMRTHQKEFSLTNEAIYGKIVGVRFTEAKVYYDIFSPYWGEIFHSVTSENVKKNICSTP